MLKFFLRLPTDNRNLQRIDRSVNIHDEREMGDAESGGDSDISWLCRGEEHGEDCVHHVSEGVGMLSHLTHERVEMQLWNEFFLLELLLVTSHPVDYHCSEIEYIVGAGLVGMITESDTSESFYGTVGTELQFLPDGIEVDIDCASIVLKARSPNRL